MKHDDLNKKYNIDPRDNMPQEVYGTPDIMMSLRHDSNYVLCSFSSKPSYGRRGGDGGYSITVYMNKNAVIEQYEFGKEESVSKETHRLLRKEMKQIFDLIAENEEKINELEDKYISCCDGNIYTFTFKGKTIIADNEFDDHFLMDLVNEIITIVMESKERYEIDPDANMPQIVYAPPRSMHNSEPIRPIEPMPPLPLDPVIPIAPPPPPIPLHCVGNVKIEYTINGLGQSETTTLSGLKNGDEFNFGNSAVAIIEIINVEQNAVTIKVKNISDNCVLPTDHDTMTLNIGDELRLYGTFKPSKNYVLRIEDIVFEEPRFYI